MNTVTTYFPTLQAIEKAAETLHGVSVYTPLQRSQYLSDKFNANVYLKREDLQLVRSYKIRGAYNRMAQLTVDERENGVVCASAGNHAQGVAFACSNLKIKGTIFMPLTTPKQKVNRVKDFGKEFIDIVLVGDTFDDASKAAMEKSRHSATIFIHPFDDPGIIEGQGTVGLEILSQLKDEPDYLFLPVGGGGLAAGVSSVFKHNKIPTSIIGVEPKGAPSMKYALEKNAVMPLDNIEKFVDGAAVKQVGKLNFEICKLNLSEMRLVDEGEICHTILDLYNKEAIVVEPAGALAVSALNQMKNEIEGKTVVCVVSGSNNDITRMEEIKERALIYKGIKHYFLVNFPQRAGALKEFVMAVLGPDDDITHFEYIKKNSRTSGTAIVGIELTNPNDIYTLIDKMKERNFFEEYLNEKPDRLRFLV